MTSKINSKQSFSLLELTVTIAILLVLVSISFPFLHVLTERSQRAKAANNLRLIAIAHANFINDFGHAISFADAAKLKGASACEVDANLIAAVLAKYGYINDVSVWAWEFDYLVRNFVKNSLYPTTIYDKTTAQIDAAFSGAENSGSFPLSVACCVVECPNFDYRSLLKNKYPAAISRGLYEGYWKKKSDPTQGGVLGNRGGLIAYFDGSVEWCNNTVNKFKKFGSTTETTSPCEALPNCHGCVDSSAWAYSDFCDWTGSNIFGSEP